MRYKVSMIALLLGVGIYGVAPVVDSFGIFDASAAHAKVVKKSSSSSGAESVSKCRTL